MVQEQKLCIRNVNLSTETFEGISVLLTPETDQPDNHSMLSYNPMYLILICFADDKHGKHSQEQYSLCNVLFHWELTRGTRKSTYQK